MTEMEIIDNLRMTWQERLGTLGAGEEPWTITEDEAKEFLAGADPPGDAELGISHP